MKLIEYLNFYSLASTFSPKLLVALVSEFPVAWVALQASVLQRALLAAAELLMVGAFTAF